jgi:hypothetical protein
MAHLVYIIRRLSIRHWAWIHFKLTLAAWSVLLVVFTPTVVLGTLGGAVILLVAGATFVGAMVSVLGIVLSAQTGSAAVVGLSVELAGLFLMLAGPVAYTITQVGLVLTDPSGSQRIALAAFAYAMCAALLCRILVVAPRRAREAHSLDKES